MSAPRFLLDTNILSEPLRTQPNPGVIQSLRERKGLLATAAIVYHEMLYGCNRLPSQSPKRLKIATYLRQEIADKLLLLPYDSVAAEWHATERARLVQIGKTPPFVDSQIAAIAATNNLTLVTNNVSDYSDFAGLTLENWFV
ncbi:MAG: type II toxin-antitoxin system VapC family toxin [Cyanobacteria bacterium P01_E01_bin.45]